MQSYPVLTPPPSAPPFSASLPVVAGGLRFAASRDALAERAPQILALVENQDPHASEVSLTDRRRDEVECERLNIHSSLRQARIEGDPETVRLLLFWIHEQGLPYADLPPSRLSSLISLADQFSIGALRDEINAHIEGSTCWWSSQGMSAKASCIGRPSKDFLPLLLLAFGHGLPVADSLEKFLVYADFHEWQSIWPSVVKVDPLRAARLEKERLEYVTEAMKREGMPIEQGAEELGRNVPLKTKEDEPRKRVRRD